MASFHILQSNFTPMLSARMVSHHADALKPEKGTLGQIGSKLQKVCDLV